MSEQEPSNEFTYEDSPLSAEKQARYNELTIQKTKVGLDHAQSAELEVLETEKLKAMSAPLSVEDEAWVSDYIKKQADPAFNPSDEEMFRFRDLRNRRQLSQKEKT